MAMPTDPYLEQFNLDLEQYNQEVLVQTRGPWEFLKHLWTSKEFIIPKDEERPVKDLMRWERYRCRNSPVDRKRTKVGKDGCDVYLIPRKMVEVLQQQATARRPPTPKQSDPPTYEAVSETPGGSGSGRQVQSTPGAAMASLPSMLELHAKAHELSERYDCWWVQMVAAEAVLRKESIGCSQRRSELANSELQLAFGYLAKALNDLQQLKWRETNPVPLRVSVALDVGRVLDDLDTFGRDMERFVRRRRVLAFHTGVTGDDANSVEAEVPDIKFLLQGCQKFQRSLKGVKALVSEHKTS